MVCPYCQSQNMQAQIVKKDKKSRVALTFVVTFLMVGLLSFIGFGAADLWAAGIYVGFFVIGLPISIVAALISLIIPAKEMTVFLCHNCGGRVNMK